MSDRRFFLLISFFWAIALPPAGFLLLLVANPFASAVL
jgi:hypothetical protein